MPPPTKRRSSRSASSPTFSSPSEPRRANTTKRRQRTRSKRSSPTTHPPLATTSIASPTIMTTTTRGRRRARRVYTRRISIPRAAFPEGNMSVWTQKNLAGLPPYFDKFYQLAQLPLTELAYKDNRGAIAKLFRLNGNNIFSRIEKVHAEANAFVREKLSPLFQSVVNYHGENVNWVSRYYDGFYWLNQRQASQNKQSLFNQITTVYCTDTPAENLKQHMATPPMFCLALGKLRHDLRQFSDDSPEDDTFLDEIFKLGAAYLCGKRPQWIAGFLSVAHGWMTALSDLSRLIIFMTRIDDKPLKEKFRDIFLEQSIQDDLPIREWVRMNLGFTTSQLRWLFPQPLLSASSPIMPAKLDPEKMEKLFSD